VARITVQVRSGQSKCGMLLMPHWHTGLGREVCPKLITCVSCGRREDRTRGKEGMGKKRKLDFGREEI
jgi:hypothetical protein